MLPNRCSGEGDRMIAGVYNSSGVLLKGVHRADNLPGKANLAAQMSQDQMPEDVGTHRRLLLLYLGGGISTPILTLSLALNFHSLVEQTCQTIYTLGRVQADDPHVP